MKKRRLGRCVCVLLAFVLGLSAFAAGQNQDAKYKGLFLTFSGNLSLAFSLTNSQFSRTGSYSYMDLVKDDGSLTMSGDKTSFGGEFSIGYFFTNMLGVVLSAGFNPKSSIGIKSDYTYSWKFQSAVQRSESKDWSSKGSASSIPLSFDLCVRFRLAPKSLLTLQGGGTLFLTQADLASKTGYGVASRSTITVIIWPYIYYITYTYADWYILDIKAGGKKSVFGGNVGFDFEQMLGPSVGLVASARYFLAPKQSYTWELIPAAKYEGQFGNLSRTIAADKSNLPELPRITTTINFSRFGFFVGVRIHV